MTYSLCDVSRYLLTEGYYPSIEYFQDSNILIGWTISFDGIKFTYRFIDNTLTVCSLVISNRDLNVLYTFTILLKKILNNVHTINHVVAIPSAIGSAENLAKIKKLFDIFIKNGAQMTVVNDCAIYTLNVKRNN